MKVFLFVFGSLFSVVFCSNLTEIQYSHCLEGSDYLDTEVNFMCKCVLGKFNCLPVLCVHQGLQKANHVSLKCIGNNCKLRVTVERNVSDDAGPDFVLCKVRLNFGKRSSVFYSVESQGDELGVFGFYDGTDPLWISDEAKESGTVKIKSLEMKADTMAHLKTFYDILARTPEDRLFAADEVDVLTLPPVSNDTEVAKMTLLIFVCICLLIFLAVTFYVIRGLINLVRSMEIAQRLK